MSRCFFFNDTATTEIYTLSLHDALPICLMLACELALGGVRPVVLERLTEPSKEPRSNGLVGQVVRMVDRRGLFERLSGQPDPPRANSGYFMFAAMPLNLG